MNELFDVVPLRFNFNHSRYRQTCPFYPSKPNSHFLVLQKKYPVLYEESMNTVLLQELIR